MSTPSNDLFSGTPTEIASAITRGWVLYFVLVTIVGIVLNVALSGVYPMLAANMQGNYWLMRIGFFAVGVAINAPVSFFAFQWAVRGKVVPAIIGWAAMPGDAQATAEQVNIPFRTIGRSLLFDLLVPWTISAVLIVLIGLMIWGFGLIAWPIAFIAFIFCAKQHQLARDARLKPVPRDALPSDEGLSAEELMQRYDIRHAGHFYSTGGMDFDRLADAIAYGRMQERNKA